MKDGILLKFSKKTREELIEKILEKEALIEKQRKQLQELEKKLQKGSEHRAYLKALKFQRENKKKKRPSIPGQKADHAGSGRSLPAEVDWVVEQKLSTCPDCHHRLSQSQEVIEHTQEDIVPAHVEVTVFKRHRYYCKDCLCPLRRR